MIKVWSWQFGIITSMYRYVRSTTENTVHFIVINSITRGQPKDNMLFLKNSLTNLVHYFSSLPGKRNRPLSCSFTRSPWAPWSGLLVITHVRKCTRPGAKRTSNCNGPGHNGALQGQYWATQEHRLKWEECMQLQQQPITAFTVTFMDFMAVHEE